MYKVIIPVETKEAMNLELWLIEKGIHNAFGPIQA